MGRRNNFRARTQARRPTQGLNSTQLLKRGRAELEAGKARAALNWLKQASVQNGHSSEADLLLFRAYHERASQLRARGLSEEALVVSRVAEEWAARVDPQALSDSDFADYIECLQLPDAIDAYAGALPARASARIERRLAERLVIERRWECLSQFEPDHPLRRDAETLKGAVLPMDEGDWEGAAALLRPLSRHSPFAPWRLFCQAMGIFSRGDDEGLQQALKLLPDDFVLAPVLQSNGHAAENAPGSLVAAIRSRRFREVKRLTVSLAETIYPEDPVEARTALLEILGIGVRQGAISLHDLQKLSRDILPAGTARLASAKIAMLAEEASHEVWNVEPAAKYLSLLQREFPDPQDQLLARARVLEHLARSGRAGGACPDCLGPQVVQRLWSVTSLPSSQPSLMLVDLMLGSLQADPSNREGYNFLLSLIRDQNAPDVVTERILRMTADHFPHDPKPCLELARLDWRRNAYRQAESWLEEAALRAPHDQSVIDLRTAGYLKSADQSRSRGKLNLAERDYLKVEKLGGRKARFVLAVKRQSLELLRAGDEALDQLEERLECLTPFQQLRFLTLLALDVTGIEKRLQSGLPESVRSLLDRRTGTLSSLSSSECVELLTPVEEDLRLVFPSFEPASLLTGFLPVLLAQAQGDDLIRLFDILLDQRQNRRLILEEIARRLEHAPEADCDSLLRFYRAVIRSMEGLERGGEYFRQVVESVPPEQRQRLRAGALRLSQFVAHGPLQSALRSFNFDLLDQVLLHPGVLESEEPFDLEEENPFEEEFEEEEDDDEFGLLDALQNMIEGAGLKGAPDSVLRGAAAQLRLDPLMRRELDELARRLHEIGHVLGRELKILLYPRKPKSKRKSKSRKKRRS
ncbi:MAG: hypothetical protein ACRD1R_19585 [Acidobacteriota bacterium]